VPAPGRRLGARSGAVEGRCRGVSFEGHGELLFFSNTQENCVFFILIEEAETQKL
jgi:hypothetical protein